MKPTVTLLGYALVIIGLINCEKNNPSSESNNYIIVVDKKSFISSSAIVELPGNPVLKDMKAVLLGSEGIFFSNKEGNNLSIKGNGMLLGFIIHSEQEDALSNGNHYINLRPPFGKGDIAIGFYALNWKDNDGVFLYEQTEGNALLAGKVAVVQKDNSINLSFNFTDENGSLIRGNYNGQPLKNLIYKADHIDF